MSKADDCIAIATSGSGANVRWANNTSTTNGVSSSRHLYVISIMGGRVGMVARSFFPEEALEGIVRESEAACDGKPEAEDAMPLVTGDAAPAWDDPPETAGIEVFATLAPRLGDLFGEARRTATQLYGYAEAGASTLYLGTSAGVRRRHTTRTGRLEINGKSDDGARSTWVGLSPPNFDDIDLEALWRKLRRNLDWSSTAIALDPGHYEVLLEPSAVGDMVVPAYWAASARDADEGRTVFSKPGGGNRIGEKLFVDGVTLYSDPAEPGMELPPFEASAASSSMSSIFDNGLANERTEWASGGVLRALQSPRWWAARTGAEPRPYIDNLVFPSDGPTIDEMIASTRRALLVTCFWYIREVDPQTLLSTGLTRDGVFLVEDGDVKGAVNNFRYNMSPIAMLAQTTQIGRSEPTMCREWGDYFPFAKMPPLRVEGFNMSSVSQAT